MSIEQHLRECVKCDVCVESLGLTFDAVALDKVPEPEPAYWAYFARNVRNRAKSRAESRRALPEIIRGLRGRGYEFVTVSELLAVQ